MISLWRFVVVAVLSSTSLLCVNAQPILDCKNRFLAVNVMDRQGNQIAGLKPSDFRATVRGQRVPIFENIGAHATRRVVILVDRSGSTRPLSAAMRTLAGNLVATQTKKVQPALVLFSDHIVSSLDFSHSPEEILKALENLPEAKGGTALLDALKYAASLFGQPRAGDAVYLITDGGENASKAGPFEVKRDFLEKGIRIYWVDLGDRYFPTEEETHREWLFDLAKSTGGQALQIDTKVGKDSQEQVAKQLQQLYEQIADFYDLQLDLPETRKWEGLRLEILDNKDKRRKDSRVLYPHELAPCGATADSGARK